MQTKIKLLQETKRALDRDGCKGMFLVSQLSAFVICSDCWDAACKTFTSPGVQPACKSGFQSWLSLDQRLHQQPLCPASTDLDIWCACCQSWIMLAATGIQDVLIKGFPVLNAHNALHAIHEQSVTTRCQYMQFDVWHAGFCSRLP